MTKKAIIKLSKRAIILGILLSLMAAFMLFFGASIDMDVSKLTTMLSVAALLAFVFILLWPAINSIEKHVTEKEKEEEDLFP